MLPDLQISSSPIWTRAFVGNLQDAEPHLLPGAFHSRDLAMTCDDQSRLACGSKRRKGEALCIIKAQASMDKTAYGGWMALNRETCLGVGPTGQRPPAPAFLGEGRVAAFWEAS